MLVYFDPWLAGVVFPSLIIVGLGAIPYIDTNPRGNGYFTLKERKWEIGTFLFGYLILWILLVILGTILILWTALVLALSLTMHMVGLFNAPWAIILPLVLAFIFLGRYWRSGLTDCATKGSLYEEQADFLPRVSVWSRLLSRTVAGVDLAGRPPQNI